MSNYSIDELLKCIQREIAYRRRVYRRLVRIGKMDEQTAQAEIEMMQAIHDNLDAQAQPQLSLKSQNYET